MAQKTAQMGLADYDPDKKRDPFAYTVQRAAADAPFIGGPRPRKNEKEKNEWDSILVP